MCCYIVICEACYATSLEIGGGGRGDDEPFTATSQANNWDKRRS